MAGSTRTRALAFGELLDLARARPPRDMCALAFAFAPPRACSVRSRVGVDVEAELPTWLEASELFTLEVDAAKASWLKAAAVLLLSATAPPPQAASRNLGSHGEGGMTLQAIAELQALSSGVMAVDMAIGCRKQPERHRPRRGILS